MLFIFYFVIGGSFVKKNSKIISSVLSFLLVFAMASCSSSDNSSDNSAEVKQTTAVSQTEVTEITTETTKDNTTGDTTDQTAINNDPAEEVDLDSLVYDFTDLKSGEMVQAFTDGKYMISYYIQGFEDTVQTMYFDKDSALIHINSQGIEYDMIYKDNKKYNIYKDSRYTEDSTIKTEQLNIFGQFGYIGDGTTEFDGKQCKYEEYYDKSGRLKTKIIFNDEGNIIALEEAGTVLYITDFKAEFDSEKIISVPENCKELSEEKFTILMYDLFNNASGTAQSTDISEESKPNN